MTRQELEQWLDDRGWRRDRYGHFHKTQEGVGPSGEKRERRLRFKLTKLAARYETRLGDGRWVRLKSAYYGALSLNPENGKLRGLTR